MRNTIRAALGVAALTAVAAAAPAPTAQAWEQCYAVLADGTPICFGSNECEGLNQRVEKITGQRWECLH